MVKEKKRKIIPKKKKVNPNKNTAEWLRANGLRRVQADITDKERAELWRINVTYQYVLGDEFKPFHQALLKRLAGHPHREAIIRMIMSGQWEMHNMDAIDKARRPK